MNESTEKTGEKSCGMGGLDYCFCAKFIIGVPAVFIISYFAASFFETPLLQVWAGAIAGIFAVWVAIKIDQMPSLSGKIIKKD